MAHPQCPKDTKTALQKEIGIIEGEIARINHETAMNSSVFGKRTNLGWKCKRVGRKIGRNFST